MGVVKVVGIGPGSLDYLAPACRAAIESADVIVGYTTYLKLIIDLATDVPRKASGMRSEVKRARMALELAAEGKTVVMVSSGDPGIYGMAGLMYELQHKQKLDVEIEVFPGISALNAAASLLGAPLMTDFAVVSLSDALVPLEQINKRLESVARTDFIICLYNPKGKKRTRPFEMACQTMSKYRLMQTWVGVVRKAFRPGQCVEIMQLKDLSTAEIDMLTVIVVGNQNTVCMDGKLVTPRGYQEKYAF